MEGIILQCVNFTFLLIWSLYEYMISDFATTFLVFQAVQDKLPNFEFVSHYGKKLDKSEIYDIAFSYKLMVYIDFVPQYIFGEFSPDEINQFFVTPRCYVEVRSGITTCFYISKSLLHGWLWWLPFTRSSQQSLLWQEATGFMGNVNETNSIVKHYFGTEATVSNGL